MAFACEPDLVVLDVKHCALGTGDFIICSVGECRNINADVGRKSGDGVFILFAGSLGPG